MSVLCIYINPNTQLSKLTNVSQADLLNININYNKQDNHICLNELLVYITRTAMLR